MGPRQASRSLSESSEANARPRVPRPPPPSSAKASATMKSNRGRDTSIELAIRKALWRANLRGFRTNYARAPGRPDIAYVGGRVAVFVHGCFWHRCPHHARSLPKSNAEYWRLKFELNRIRDERKVADLRSLGWTVVTLWECEIRSKSATCVGRVRLALGHSPLARGRVAELRI